jgi:O-antigen ligase
MLKASALLSRLPSVAGSSPIAPSTTASTLRSSLVAAMVLSVVLLLLTTSRAVVAALLGLLSVWALFGPARAIQAMALAVIVKYANPGLVEQGVESGPLSWLVLLAAGVRVLPMTSAKDASTLGFVWCFAVLAAMLSAFASVAPTISLLKAATFAWVISTLFVALRTLSPAEALRLNVWFATLGVIVIGFSALTLVAPGIAFLRNGTGLQGVLSHPQTLAIIAAPVAALTLTAVLLRPRGIGWLMIGLTALAWFVLLLTEARTGLFAAAVGTSAGMAMHLWRGNCEVQLASRAKLVGFGTVAAVALGVFVASSNQLSESVEGFLLKRSGVTDIGDAFYQSRGQAVVSQWRSFLERPLTGHGLGVYAGGELRMDVVEFAGVPISAPVEKGILPTAVLEETGLIGSLAFLAMLLHLTWLAWRGGDPRGFALFTACVATNVGEAQLLSPGAPGLLLWCLIGLAVRAGLAGPEPATGRPEGTGESTSPERFPQVMR